MFLISLLLSGNGIFMVFQDGAKATRFILSKDVYDKVISKDHILFRINEEIDFSFVNNECKDLYNPDIGRNVTNYPEIMFKAEIIQFMNCYSERQLRNQVSENLVYRWFLGYELDDTIFHFTAPGKFRNALGEDRHRVLFNQILNQFKKKGLLNEYENQSIDATHIISDIAIPTTIGLIKQAIVTVLKSYNLDCSVNREYYLGKNEKKEYKMTEKEKRLTLKRVVIDAKSLIDHFTYVDGNADDKTLESLGQLKNILKDYIEDVENKENSDVKERIKKGKDRIVSIIDKDARWGAKSDNKVFCGYKAHSTQTDRQIITDIKVTPGNLNDDKELPSNLNRQKEKGLSPKKIRGDGIYGTIDNRKISKELGTKLVAPVRTTHNSGRYFPKEEFNFDEDNNIVMCPAGRTTAICYWNKKTQSWVYHFKKENCEQCGLKVNCTSRSYRTISISKDYAIQQEAAKYSNTSDYKEDMRIRSHIEPKQAEMKRFHGLARATYRGLNRVNVQAIYTALVVNLKRMVRLLNSESYRENSKIA
jgi:transposase